MHGLRNKILPLLCGLTTRSSYKVSGVTEQIQLLLEAARGKIAPVSFERFLERLALNHPSPEIA
jgi:hypothetical protein